MQDATKNTWMFQDGEGGAKEYCAALSVFKTAKHSHAKPFRTSAALLCAFGNQSALPYQKRRGDCLLVTMLCAILLMAGLFLLLLGGVGFVQDRRFFTSAPKDVRAVLEDKRERFKGQHVLGWFLIVISILMMAGAMIYGILDGIKNGFPFVRFFIRFLVMLLLLKAFDIFVFDWILLCHSDFFPHFYPETKPYLGPHLFGFNKKEHIIHTLLFVSASAVISWICTLF
jgi:ABC-type Fe3+ transport system permease subunit